MAFSKSFPRTIKGTNYPSWEEVFLTEAEEREEENKSRRENNQIMNECIEDAKNIIEKKNLKRFQTDMINIAIALFHKRASYTIHYKENKAKEKFDKRANP